MHSIKIALAAPVPPPYGGISNWVLLIKNYIKNRNDIEVININTAPKKRDVDGRNLWDRFAIQSIIMIKQYRLLKKTLNSGSVDILHITTSGQFAIFRDIILLRLAKRYNIPAVYHIRFGRIPEIVKMNTMEWKMLKKALILAKNIITIDKKTENAVKSFIPSVNVKYIPNPFDFKNIDININESNKKEIVFLGWCIKTKGIEELLIAWSQISLKYDDWNLRLVGPIKNDYYKLIKKQYSFDHVIIEGELSHNHAMDRLKNASIFILPSYTEGFPNVVLEAMAYKKPIIATEVGAIPEILSDGCGILIPVMSSKSIADAIEMLINDEIIRYNISQKAYDKIHFEYNMDMIFKKYMDLWLDII